MTIVRTTLLLVAATACAAATAHAETPRRGGVLSFAAVAEPPTLDCHATTTFATLHPVAPHYSGLLKVAGDVTRELTFVGDLARSWEMSKDGLTFTFRLRDGVRFHDGTPLTSDDVKESYQRIIQPPAGIVSARQALHRDIAAIETPDPLTVVFRLSAPNASMATNFASPFNCIYSAARLRANPKAPETEIIGTGPFKHVEYQKGEVWKGARFEGYFDASKPYLDGYRVFFVKSNAVVPGLIGGQFDAEFRGRTPGERDQLVAAMGDKVVQLEGPWTTNLMLTFNTRKKPFDDVRVRQALTMAIDRWGGAQALARISLLRHVGGLTRPGSSWALPESELERLPGFGRDIEKARAEAKRLLAEAGASDLKIRLVNRNVAEPFTPGGLYVIDQWRRIGVVAEHVQLETKAYFSAQSNGDFDAAIDGITDFMDDPSLQFAKFIPGSSVNASGAADPELDELSRKQASATDPVERKALVDAFNRRALTQAYSSILFWWQRIVVMNKKIRGWELHASHFTGQDLAGVWLAE